MLYILSGIPAAVTDTADFTAGFDVGYRIAYKDGPLDGDPDGGPVQNDRFLELRPSFYYKLFGNFLNVGLKAGMELGFNGGRHFPDGPAYNFWFFEPQVRVNFNANLHAAAVYRYTAGLYRVLPSFDPDQTTHWINIRLCYTF